MAMANRRKTNELRRGLMGAVGQLAGFHFARGSGATMAPTLARVMRGHRVHDDELLNALGGDVAIDEVMTGDIDAIEETAAMLAAPMIIPAGKGGKATALVSARGVALYDVEFQPYCFSTLLLGQTVTALANDPEVGTVIVDIDSPGGLVTGTPEAGDAIFAARSGAQVVALINPLAASAAYWLASQAAEVVAVPSADVGSIGVFMLHCDLGGMLKDAGIVPTFVVSAESPYKVEGNPYEALGDEARAHYQAEIDAVMKQFVAAVARGRGVSRAQVLADFGKGRTLMAPDAKKAGMIDRIAPVHQAMARWGVSTATLDARRRGETADPAPTSSAVTGETGPEAALPADDASDQEDGSTAECVACDRCGVIYDSAAFASACDCRARAAAADPLRYARVGGPPDNWQGLKIFNEETGAEIDSVVEVDCDLGFIVCHARNEDGEPFVDPQTGEVVVERIEGRFRIETDVDAAEQIAFGEEDDGNGDAAGVATDRTAEAKARARRLRLAKF